MRFVLVPVLPVLLVLLVAACAPSIEDDDGEIVEPPAVQSGPCEALPSGVTSGARGELDRVRSETSGRIVLMGGGTEVDRGSALFVDGALGGDVLVLRASGSTESYTSYFAEELTSSIDVPAASVTTLLLDDPALAADAAVLCRVDGAEAIWLAGGDQADYLVRWPDALRDALTRAVDDGVAVGGTSAGAMSLSALAFDALNGSVTSEEALANPNDDLVRVSPSPFAPAAMADTIVDTHFVAREREGRLLAFLDRALVDGAARVVGVGLDESGTALIVEPASASFTFLADDDATAFVYEANGPEAAEEGALDLEGVKRVRLVDGNAGAWPKSFADAELVDVIDGVVTPRP